METRDRKARNFIQTNFQALLWHGLPVAALVIWGAFCITNNLCKINRWCIFCIHGVSSLEAADLYHGDG